MRRPKTGFNKRTGVAVVELAVCLPVLILLVLGTISSASMIYFKQSLKIVAYEGARVSLIPGSSNGAVTAQCESLMIERRIEQGSVSVSPNIASSPEGTIITVTVEAPCGPNGLFASLLYSGRTFSTTVSMMKEN
jgi:Flp pilus assembly protein TadG